MVESFKQIKNRIRSVENTRKVTHAMEMISIAKLRPIENRLSSLRTYFLSIESLLKTLLPKSKDVTNSLLKARQSKGKLALCIITSDSGLCGVYNDNILRVVNDFISKKGEDNILLVTVGKKGLNHFRGKGMNLKEKFIELKSSDSDYVSDRILKTLADIYLFGEVDEVYLAYTYFKSLSRSIPTIEKMLEINFPNEKEIDYIFEPDINSILNELIHIYLSYKMKSALLSSFASEYASRMMSMGKATHNADELLDELILSRNKIRQASITGEIMEIISSAEALR